MMLSCKLGGVLKTQNFANVSFYLVLLQRLNEKFIFYGRQKKVKLSFSWIQFIFGQKRNKRSFDHFFTFSKTTFIKK